MADHDHDHHHNNNSHDHDHTDGHDHHECKEKQPISTRPPGDHHQHSHHHLHSAGDFSERDLPRKRKFSSRAFCVGIGGPVGSGKTALMLALCKKLKENLNLCAVTNDIFTREDGEFLIRNGALPEDRILAVETGGCPHAAIREDITANLIACEDLTSKHGCDIILLESGGDNLAADFSRELADYTVYVIDTAGGDKVPRKGGPGITQSDLLVVNKIDLAEAVGASLDVFKRDAKLMRGDGPVVFAQAKHDIGVELIADHILQAWKKSRD